MTETTINVPPHYSLMMPYLMVADVVKAVDFYVRAFGCTQGEMPLDDTGHIKHGEFSYHGQVMMCGQQDGFGPTAKPPRVSGVESPLSLYLYCQDVDAFFAHAKAHGAKVRGAPEAMFWGDRMCRLEDPDGYIWCFATPMDGAGS